MKQLLIIFILFIFCSCSAMKRPEETSLPIENNLTYYFERFVSSELKENSGMKIVPLSIEFYMIDNTTYFQIIKYPGILLKNLKGYTQYDNSIILYYGINDSIAKRYMNLSEPDYIKLSEDFIVIDSDYIDIHDNNIKNYVVIEDTIFMNFKPDEEHLDKLHRLHIVAGIKSLPPPPSDN